MARMAGVALESTFQPIIGAVSGRALGWKGWCARTAWLANRCRWWSFSDRRHGDDAR